MRSRPALTIAVLAAVVATFAAAIIRFQVAGSRTPEAWLPLLVAFGLACVSGLTIDRRPSAAWLATIGILTITTLDLAGIARANRSTIDDDAWRWLSIAICLSAVAASSAAIAYAADPTRQVGRWVPAVGLVTIVGIGAACLWALAMPPSAVDADQGTSSLGSLTVVTRSFLATVVGFVLLGLAGDARPAMRRTRRRLEATSPPASGSTGRMRYAIDAARIFIDECSPGRSRAHQAAVAERSRIARELHAEVVPSIRRALTEAERDGSVERLAVVLREVLADVDDLVRSTHAIQLEVGGLVPAIEWLAERTEDRSDVRVTIDVVDPGQGSEAAPPMDVAAAAFRVAGLALENVIRHAPGASAGIEVRATADQVRLIVTDDGPGIEPKVYPLAPSDGRRGLADMVAEASACGASVDVTSGSAGRGTTVAFLWPAT